MQKARKVTAIPATIERFTESPLGEMARRRVAAYARVSTELEEQQNSYQAQVDYYTNMITGKEGWTSAGIFTDEGISGTSTAKRDGFRRMMDEALAGRIDLIITKSVSRFARNTVDSLVSIRSLKEHGVEVFFEKENIWTFDAKGEMLLTIMSSLAQEESRSISENVTWGIRKRFADGKVVIPYKRFLGYRKGPDGNPEIVPEEAVTVRLIYDLFMKGLTPGVIASRLTEKGIPSPAGKERWHGGTIRSILTNEKYAGDAVLQKSYTADFLSKKSIVNNGEVPKYLVENSHEAIIQREQFDLVQQMMNRKEGDRRKLCTRPFSGKVFCGDCGSVYGSKIWHSTDKYRKVVWQCDAKFSNARKCTTPHFREEDLERIYVDAANRVIAGRKRGTQAILDRRLIESLDTAGSERKLERIDAGIEAEAALAARSLSDPMNGSRGSDYDRHAMKIEQLKRKRAELAARIGEMKLRKGKVNGFLDELKKAGDGVRVFNPEQFALLVDRITVYSRDSIKVTFNDGTML